MSPAPAAHCELITDEADWRAALKAFPPELQDVYFAPEYARAHCAEEGDPVAFLASAGDDRLFIPFVRRPVPEGFCDEPAWDLESPYGYSGPLATSEDRSVLDEAWSAMTDTARGEGMVAALIRFHPVLRNAERFAGGGVTVIPDRQTVSLDLGQTSEQIWAAYDRTVRNKVRKAINAGVTVALESGPEALETFIGLYHERMEQLSASEEYLFPRAYFEVLASLGPERVQVFLARFNGDPVGGALILRQGPYVHYHLSAAPRQHQALGVANLLRHEITVRYAGQPGAIMHYGGGRSAAPDDPLFRFKTGYSPDRRQFSIGSLVIDPERYGRICERWRAASPDSAQRFEGRVLKYRF